MKKISPMLEMSDISVVRGGREVLHVPSFSLKTNETVAILGPNGSGKSTFLLIASLLLKPTKGKISYFGKSIKNSNRTPFRRMTALAFQEPLLLDRSVSDNLKIALRLKRPDLKDLDKIADVWLEKLKIQHLAKVLPHQLSGGELQRASLARVFAVEPTMVFLDEPFAGIDEIDRPSLSGDVKALIKESGAASLLVTHDISEAVLLAKRLVVLSDGKVIQEGDVSEVIAKPISEEIAKLLGYSVFNAEEFSKLFQIDRPTGNFTEVAVPMSGIKAFPSIEGLGKIVRLEVSVKGLVAVIALGNQQLHTEVDYGDATFSGWSTGSKVDVSIDYSRIVWLPG